MPVENQPCRFADRQTDYQTSTTARQTDREIETLYWRTEQKEQLGRNRRKEEWGRNPEGPSKN
jgi:hypothetical protein